MVVAISAEDLTKRYDDLDAVKGITFDIPEGTVHGFLGPNGAGKTSTLRMIYGLSPITSGRLRILGMSMPRDARRIKARIGVVPQENNLDEDMTARENLDAFGHFFGLRGRALRERADDLLEYVHLAGKADARVSELSGGMRRRLLIARALVNDPDLLLLDEPTTGLDPQSRALLWDRIREQRKAGKTVLLTTHYMDEAEKLSDCVMIMHAGRIIERGTPRSLIARHIGREVVEARVDARGDDTLLVAAGAHARGHERLGDELRIFTHDADAVLDAVARSHVKPETVLARRASLEDVFLKLTGRGLDADDQ